MGPDLTAPRRADACPTCGAARRPDATFCGQCYADFRPATAPQPQAAPAPAAAPAQAPHVLPAAPPGPGALDPLTASLLDLVLPQQPTGPASTPAAAPAPPSVTGKAGGWPCSQCQSLNDLDSTSCAVCGGSFLAPLSGQGKVSLVLPVVGDLGRYSRGQRVGIAFGAMLLLLLPLALVTLLLTKAPATAHHPGAPSGSVSTTNGNPGTSGSGDLSSSTGTTIN